MVGVGVSWLGFSLLGNTLVVDVPGRSLLFTISVINPGWPLPSCSFIVVVVDDNIFPVDSLVLPVSTVLPSFVVLPRVVLSEITEDNVLVGAGDFGCSDGSRGVG